MASQLSADLHPENIRTDRSPTDLLSPPPREVLERLARLAACSLRAPVVVVALRDGTNHLVATAAFGTEPDSVHRVPVAGTSLFSAVAVPDRVDVAGAAAVPALRMAEALGVRACLMAPLIQGGTVVGVLAAGDLTSRHWTADEQQIVDEFAALVADAVGRSAELRHRAAADQTVALHAVLSSLAHELNNPLTSIKSFAQLLLLDERSSGDRDGLETIQQEADRAAKLVADLRTLARQARYAIPDAEPTPDIDALVHRAERSFCGPHAVGSLVDAVAATPLRVLLVEAAAPIRESLARFLELRGHQVDAVPQPRQALQCLDGGAEYQMVVSGALGHGRGRCELLDRLAATDGVGRRVVFLVDEDARGDAERVAAASGAPVVVKPFAPVEVAELIERRAVLL